MARHGRADRREAAELCRISGPQAYRLPLERLAERGFLTWEDGRGRGVGHREGTT